MQYAEQECTENADLGHDDDLVSWQIMLLDGFSKNDLGCAVRVRLSADWSVSGVDSRIRCEFNCHWPYQMF